MKKCELCFQVKDSSGFYKCSARKDGLQGYCKLCCHKKTNERIAKHPEIHKELWAKRKGVEKYKVMHRLASERYRKSNREITNKRVSLWTSNNLHKHAEYQAKRRATKLRSTPVWANRFFIEEAYDLAKRRTELKTGGHKWHVDHIVPLKSDLVCGLHVENNLRVIPAFLNASKGNRIWPDMPERFEV